MKSLQLLPICIAFGLSIAPWARGAQPASDDGVRAVSRVSHAVPFCALPPAVDGKLNDDCWESALRLGRFYYRHSGAPPRVYHGRNTEVSVLFEATFDTGLPAIVSHRVGRGRTLLFAWNPFNAGTVKDAGWPAYFSKLHGRLGGAVGHDIWRFQFPDDLVAYRDPDPPGDACITGNYAFWHRAEFVDGGERYNVDTNGRYTLDVGGAAPQANAFSDGALTDRLDLRTDPNVYGRVRWWDLKAKFKLEDWCEVVRNPAPLVVTFSFPQAQRITCVRLFYAGELPGLAVETPRRLRGWRVRAVTDQPHTTGEAEVACRSLALKRPVTAKQVRLRIPPRQRTDMPLVLVEAELWGARP